MKPLTRALLAGNCRVHTTRRHAAAGFAHLQGEVVAVEPERHRFIERT